MRCRIDQCRAAPGVKVYEGDRRIQGCTQGPKVTEVWLTSCCCEHTRVLQGQLLSGHTLSQNRSVKGCTHGTLTEQGYKVWATCCCCEHTHVCCRMCQFRGAPRSQGLQRSGEPIAAVSIHSCVAEKSNKSHQRTKGCKSAVSTDM